MLCFNDDIWIKMQFSRIRGVDISDKNHLDSQQKKSHALHDASTETRELGKMCECVCVCTRTSFINGLTHVPTHSNGFKL